MKQPLSFLLVAVFFLATYACAAEEPVAITVRTRNWQGYMFQISIAEDGRYARRFRKDGGPDISEAPVIDEGMVSESNREHLAKIIERSGVLGLNEDMTKKDLSVDAAPNRLEGELRVKRGLLDKTIRFGPNVESIPDSVSAVLSEISRLAQEKK
jgi:hypothetical protein